MYKVVIFIATFSLSLFSQEITNENVEYITWETQSWDGFGMSEKITITKEGESSFTVNLSFGDFNYTKLRELGYYVFVKDRDFIATKEHILNREAARDVFKKLVDAGIVDLKPLKANYVDGGGTVVGIGSQKNFREYIIAHFAYDENSVQYSIFMKCLEILKPISIKDYWSCL